MSGRPHVIGPLGLAVARNVKRLRAEAHMSRRELSDKLQTVGINLSPVPSIQRIETEERRVDVDEFIGLAAVFGITPQELMDNPAVDEYRRNCLRWLLAEAEWLETKP